MDASRELEFLAGSRVKAAAKKILYKVSEVIEKDESRLKDKRNRLGDFLSGETATLDQELEIMKTKEVENSITARKNRSLAVQVEKEAQRKRLAEMKLELYIRDNNEELKTKEALEKCREAADFNKHTIEKNNKKKLVQKEVENILDELLLQQELKKVEAEELALRKKVEERIYDFVVLRNQIAEKALKVKEEFDEVVDELARMRQLTKEFEDSEKQEIMKKEESRINLAKEKYEDMVNSLEAKKQRKIFELEQENYYARTKAPFTDEDPLAENMKRQLKLEQDLFMETQRNLKDQLRTFEIHEDELRKYELEKKEEAEAKKRIENHIKRSKEFQDILQTQIFQVLRKSGPQDTSTENEGYGN